MANLCNSEIVVKINENTIGILRDLLDVNIDECNLKTFIDVMKDCGIEFDDDEMKYMTELVKSRDVSLIPWYDELYLVDDEPSEVYIGGQSKWDFPCELAVLISNKLNGALSFIAYEPGNYYCWSYGDRFDKYEYIVDADVISNIAESFQGYYLINNKSELLSFISESFEFDIGELEQHSSSCMDIVEYMMNAKPEVFDTYPISMCEIKHYMK